MDNDTEIATRDTTPKAELSLDSYVRRDDHVEIWAIFGICCAAMIAAAIVMVTMVPDGVWLVVMGLMGSMIIIALMSAAAVPHLQTVRRAMHH